MKFNKLTEVFDVIENFTKKNSPAILSGLAVVGVISTAVTAYKAAPKAEEIIERRKKELKNPEVTRKEVNIQTLKEMTPVMLPPVIMGTATTACILGSHSISSRRIAAISAAYSISEKSVKELNSKMTEVLGEKKTRAIKDAIAKDKIGKAPEEGSNQVVMVGDGKVLCKDLYSGRFFYSNAEKIGQAINQMNFRIMYEYYISLNEFYEEIGLPQIPMGNDLGWNMDDVVGGSLPISYTAILTDDGRPCLAVDYDTSLRSDFRNLH